MKQTMSRRLRSLLASGLVITILLAFTVPVSAQEPDPEPEPVTTIVTGRGWGHGRGLGQYGAQGYALMGWTSAEILQHYYSNTDPGPTPAVLSHGMDASAMRVELRAQRNTPLRFHLADPAGTLILRDEAGNQLHEIADATAVRIRAVDGKLGVDVAPTCGGAWEELAVHELALIDITPNSSISGSGSKPRVCHDDGSSTWYEGVLRAVLDSGQMRAVNIVTIEQYLRGVVPAEVPASWEPAALEAQAVAARSYALAGDDRQQPYADTCDTTRCQVYRGLHRQLPGAALKNSTHPATDAAVADTAGLVRLFSDGTVARTEFSSSTGGHTVDGTKFEPRGFPAVVDEGDSVASNPNHTWSTQVNLTAWIEAQELGPIVRIDETERNGRGADGGRVLEVTFRFQDGEVILTGNEARQTFGLKSDWFTFGPVGAELLEAEANFVRGAYELFLRRSPSVDEETAWVTALSEGRHRFALTNALALDEEWAGVQIQDLYQTVFGRRADAGGLAFWLAQVAGGRRLENVAAEFYGSPEYFQQVGGTTEAFVTGLYEDIQGRPADAGGHAFWVALIDSGSAHRGRVAAGFYASPESREGRVRSIYLQVLGRSPDAAGLAFWTEKLLVTDDVRLAAELASSQEFFDRSQA